MGRPADSSMRSSRSTKRQASCRARSVPMVARPVGIRLEKGSGLIVDGARGGLRLEIKRIIAREPYFHEASSAFHGIKPGADEIAVEKDIARHRVEIHVGKSRLQDLGTAANRIKIEFPSALCADERATGGFHNDVARHLL